MEAKAHDLKTVDVYDYEESGSCFSFG